MVHVCRQLFHGGHRLQVLTVGGSHLDQRRCPQGVKCQRIVDHLQGAAFGKFQHSPRSTRNLHPPAVGQLHLQVK